jgi:hypothetical protein
VTQVSRLLASPNRQRLVADIPLLGTDRTARVDYRDLHHVCDHDWRLYQTSSRHPRRTDYAITRINGRNVYLHLHLWHCWELPTVPVVDHEDGNGLHCTWLNLRDATVGQNNCNRGPLRTNTSGFKGVTWHKRDERWQAAIGTGNEQRFLGYFADAAEAARAYDEAAKKFHGSFAVLNFR